MVAGDRLRASLWKALMHRHIFAVLLLLALPLSARADELGEDGFVDSDGVKTRVRFCNP